MTKTRRALIIESWVQIVIGIVVFVHGCFRLYRDSGQLLITVSILQIAVGLGFIASSYFYIRKLRRLPEKSS